MTNKYKEIISTTKQQLDAFGKEANSVMQGFQMMHKAANQSGSLNNKTKELIALALGVAARCDGCIAMHTESLIRLGATREEIIETLSVVAYMGGGPSLMYVAHALDAFDELKK